MLDVRKIDLKILEALYRLCASLGQYVEARRELETARRQLKAIRAAKAAYEQALGDEDET